MLAIRMQRTGRKGHAMFRLVVQDAHRTPTSGKVIAFLGSYDPHTKATILAKDKASFYLEHGAQPSERVARLLKNEGVKLPTWVKIEDKKASALRNPEKLRRNRPAEAVAPAEPVVPEEVTDEVIAATTAEAAEPAETEPIATGTPTETEAVAELAEPAEEVSEAVSAEDTDTSADA